MKQLTTIGEVKRTLKRVAEDQVDVIHQMADERGLDSENLTLRQYKKLVAEEATFSYDCTDHDDAEEERDATRYRDRLLGIAKRIAA